MASPQGLEFVNNCLQFVPITLIIYDWALMLGEEIDLIWTRPMKANVIFYFAARYFPFAVVILRFWVFVPVPLHAVRVLSLTDIAAMMAIIALVQVLLQTRIYAMYNKSKRLLWTNASLFIVEYAITIFLVLRLSSSITPGHVASSARCRACTVHPRIFAAAYVAPLCYESYLVFLAVRKSWLTREASRHLGATSIVDILARGSALYFILVASGMALSMVLFLVAPSFVRWLDLLTDATSSIGGARLILSVRKAFLSETEDGSQKDTMEISNVVVAFPPQAATVV